MSPTHTVVWIDHHSAQILQFDGTQVEAQQIRTHQHHTRQHGSTVRTEHEFFGEVCDGLLGIGEVLVTGGHTATSDFKHYAEKHRPAIAKSLVGYEIVDRVSGNQLVSLARKYFTAHDAAANRATPN